MHGSLVRLCVNSGIVSITIAPEGVSNFCTSIFGLLDTHWLRKVFLFAHLVVTSSVIVASHISFLSKSELNPVFPGFSNPVFPTEGSREVRIPSQVAISLNISDSWSTLGVSSLEMSVSVVVHPSSSNWVLADHVTCWIEGLACFLCCLLGFFVCSWIIQRGERYIRESLQIASCLILSHFRVTELVSSL